MKTTISVALAVYNESEFIAACLNSVVDWVDEIIIVDGQSSDDTAKIAKKYAKVKLISTTNKPMFHLNKQMAIDACKSHWILQLDADEVVSPELRDEIIKVIQSPDAANGYWLNRSNFFLGRFLTKGGQYPDPTLRLYRRGLGHLPCLSVHEQAEVTPPVAHLQSDLLHYADRSFSRYLLRNNRYTSLMATDMKEHKINLNIGSFISYFLLKPMAWFLKTYFRHLGLVDGFPGFVFCWYSSLRFPLAYIKYFELTKTDHA